MAADPRKVEITHSTDIVALTEEVENTQEERLLLRGGRTVARLSPVYDDDVPEGQPFTQDDPLWALVGAGQSEGPTDVASNKHAYLAQAIYEESHPSKTP